jgi:hypothetical protein
MAEFFFFLFLLAPLLIAWWMITAKRKAERLLRDRAEARTAAPETIAYEESTLGADGLSYGRSHAGDTALLPPEDPTASLEGIKAIEGRR